MGELRCDRVVVVEVGVALWRGCFSLGESLIDGERSNDVWSLF